MPVFDSLLNNIFQVERRTRTSDGQGGWTIGYTSVDPVLGRIRPASSKEREVAAQEQREISHVWYTRTGKNIERGDRVTCGVLAVEVLGIREPSLANEHWEIDCLQIQIEVSGEAGS